MLLQITYHIYSPKKCKEEYNNIYCLNIILVQGFHPLKIEITQFPDGFHLEPVLWLIINFFSLYHTLKK